MPVLTPQDFNNIKRDIEDTGKAINTDADVIPRSGAVFKSIPKISRLFEEMLGAGYVSLDDLQQAINIAAAAGAGAEGWSDLLIQTVDGRNQRVINAEFNEKFEKGKTYYIDMFGANNTGEVDNTEIYSALESNLSDGDTVKWGSGKYLGSFVSTKSLILDTPADCELIQPFNKPLIKFSSSFVNYSVIESLLNPGDIKFTLSGVLSIPAGSLIVLWNNMWRDFSTPVNFEIFKVHSITIVNGNTEVYPEKPIQSVQYGTITADLCVDPLKGVVLDIKGQITNTTDHFERCTWLDGVDTPEIKNIKTRGTKGHALSLDRCYNVKVGSFEFRDPLAVDSGAGYGLTLFRCSTGVIGAGKCFNMRHDIDLESSYNIVTAPHTSYFPKSSVIVASHNGFCGNISIGDVTISVSDFPTEVFGVSAAGQGYRKLIDGEYKLDRETRLKHPIRNLQIGNVVMTVDEKKSVTDRISGVNLDVELLGPKVGRVDITYKNTTIPAGTNQSIGVNVTGYSDLLTIGAISANVIGQIANLSNKNGDQRVGVFNIGAINVLTSNYGVYTSGYSPEVSSFQYDRILRNMCLECADNSAYGQNAVYASINNVSQHRGANTTFAANPISVSFVLASGNSYVQGLYIGTSLVVTDGMSISSKELQIRNGIVVLSTPSASVTPILTISLPVPSFYNGQLASICNGNAGVTDRSQVILGGVNMASNITIDSGKVANLVSVGGKWRLK